MPHINGGQNVSGYSKDKNGRPYREWKKEVLVTIEAHVLPPSVAVTRDSRERKLWVESKQGGSTSTEAS